MKVSLWAEIHRLHDVERLSRRAIARQLGCNRKTVQRALKLREPPRLTRALRGSILDPYKKRIDELILGNGGKGGTPDLSAERVLEELRKLDDPYSGEIDLVRKYLREIRPARSRTYNEVDWAPGQAMQVDWGTCGTTLVGESRRRVSVFVATLCFSKMTFIAFTLSQKKELFYRCIVRAFEFFGGVAAHLIVDNLKAAVIRGSGKTAVFHEEFATLCACYGATPVACEKSDPETKGSVEGRVKFVKHNALKGRDEQLATFEGYLQLEVDWRDNVANVKRRDRDPGKGERPVDRLQVELPHLKPLPAVGYPTDEVVETKVSSHRRVWLETNRYSAPAELAGKRVLLRADDATVRIIHRGQEVARHRRSWERGKILTLPEHDTAAAAMRSRATQRDIEARFAGLGPVAISFHEALVSATRHPVAHQRKILQLARIHGNERVTLALCEALRYQTFDSAYIENLIAQARRREQLPESLPICPRRAELVEDQDLDLDAPDLSIYDSIFDIGDYDTDG